jgi:hypothetical protein
VCLSRTAPRQVAPTRTPTPTPTPMACLTEMLVNKRADDDEDDG